MGCFQKVGRAKCSAIYAKVLVLYCTVRGWRQKSPVEISHRNHNNVTSHDANMTTTPPRNDPWGEWHTPMRTRVLTLLDTGLSQSEISR